MKQTKGGSTMQGKKVILEFCMEIWYCYDYENGSMANPLFTSTSYDMAEAEAKDAGYEVAQVIGFEDEELEKATPATPIQESKHTQGEWEVNEEENTVCKYRVYNTTDGSNVVWVDIDEEYPGEHLPLLNLIASAPRLYRDNVRLQEENKELKEVLGLMQKVAEMYITNTEKHSDSKMTKESTITHYFKEANLKAKALLNRDK